MTMHERSATDRDFLAGTGEMATLMRAYDWTKTSLGPPETWPSGLRTAVRLLLNSYHPMHIFWGPEATFFYNDGFVPSAGPERHPSALGRPAAESWGEIWPVIGSEVAKVRNGSGHTWYEDQHVPILRHGVLEDAYWTYGFSPIDDDTAPNGTGGVISILTETTKRKVLERNLRDINTTLEQRVEETINERDQIWELSVDLLSVTDVGKGYFTRLNPAWTASLGWSVKELLERPFIQILHPNDLERTSEALKELMGGQSKLRFENRYLCKDGSYRWLSWNPILKNGLVYSVTRDITEQKAQAEALAQAEETLRQSQKMEAVGQLTGGLAHDFNNLLAVVTGNLELMAIRLGRGKLDDLDRFIAAAQAAAKRATALTHRLLAFSRRQTLDPKVTGVNELVHDMRDMINRTAGPEIVVEFVADADLWTALVDPNQLENALLNLCINARDAMPNGGLLTIETSNQDLGSGIAAIRDLASGQYIALSITDTGTGMSPELVTRVFEPFFTTKPIGQGTGLGLSMVYGFARQSDGQVRIHSEVGRGTTVTIYLPRSEQVCIEDRINLVALPQPAERGQMVLVVDDELAVRLLIEEVLRDLGYGIIEAGDGPAALTILQTDMRIDLLITDVGMPGMNGRQLADAARLSRPQLKTLFITGYAEAAVISHGHLDASMAVMTKPFALDVLANRVRAMIEAPVAIVS